MENEDGVSLRLEMPLSWAALPSLNELDETWVNESITLLQYLSTLEEAPTEKSSELGAMARILDRLDTKLDVTLNLLSKLLASRSISPISMVVTLSATSLEWIDRNPPEAHSEILLSLYLHPKLPQPLVLPAKVISILNQPEGKLIHAAFMGLTEELADWLERTVFRYHRRAIHSRQGYAPK